MSIFNNDYIRIDISKNIKLPYYIRGVFILLTPTFFYQRKLKKLLKTIGYEDKKRLMQRVDYYNKIEDSFFVSNNNLTIKKFKREKKRTYFFDMLEYLKYFNQKKKISYLFGDITHIPEVPSFVKSRPISGDNQNSIILKLDKVRHFIFLKDKIKFEDKKSILIWRGKAHQAHRKYFLDKFYTHPLCDVGQIRKKSDGIKKVLWLKEKLSLKQHLNYKFILTIEGNDVASNLKWVMSSNSLAFMIKPKYETWFMEGRLIPNYHYVLLKDDYSDLEEKIKYYSTHTKESKEIISNAHNYIKQFKNKKDEDLISLMVIKKYFQKSNQ